MAANLTFSLIEQTWEVGVAHKEQRKIIVFIFAARRTWRITLDLATHVAARCYETETAWNPLLFLDSFALHLDWSTGVVGVLLATGVSCSIDLFRLLCQYPNILNQLFTAWNYNFLCYFPWVYRGRVFIRPLCCSKLSNSLVSQAALETWRRSSWEQPFCHSLQY